MDATKKPRAKKGPAFFDDEERELIESFEAALENGEVTLNSEAELNQIKLQWRERVEASLQQRDFRKLLGLK